MSKNGFIRKGAYVFHGLRKRFLRRPFPRVRDHASEITEVCPAERGVMPAPVTLAGHTSRATGNAHGDDVADYVMYATMTTCVHSATLLYRVEDVVLDNGFLYKGTLAEYVSSLGWPRNRKPEILEQMVLTASQSGSGFFGDWLTADNLLELLANSLGIAPLKVQPHVHYPHLRELNRLLNLKEGYSDMVSVRNLYIVDDAGYNANKRIRLQTLRSNLRKNLRKDDCRNGLVYIYRGEGHQSVRRLVNEREVVDFLARKGFQFLDPTKLSAAEILAGTLNSRVVVGVEGSQLAYGFLSLKEGGLMMTLQPPSRFESSWRPQCVSVGVDWGFLVGVEVPGGFTISPAELEEVLEPFI